MAELAKAYVQIIPSAEGIQGRLTEVMGGEADKAGSAAGKRAGTSFGSAFKGVAAVGAAALGAAAAGVGALGKAAVEGYADYEQLIGGVETLFKDSAGTVEDYANQAYETAGLSANEYMETVTSFSASLLQSLGGDTAEAAKYADQAIIDMSDNANKMGTDMESIQNAYQGFAKQNFTMLDNLKLGYGGTKEEMQRLLDDASALSGLEFDISSFADITEAVHIIQSEMGITGTTAQEASETISGSLSALGGAWSNLVTGMASDDADLDQLIGTVVSSAETALGNLLPVAEQALSGVASLVEGLAPVIAEKLPGLIDAVLPSLLSAATTLVTAVVEALPSIMQVLIDQGPVIINQLITTILEMLPQIIELGLTLLTSLATGIADNLPELIPTIIDVVLQIVDTLTNPDNLIALVDAAIAIIVALADGLIDSLPSLLEKAPEIIANLVEAIIRAVPQLLKAALEIVVKLASGIIDNLGRIKETAGKIISTVAQGVVSLLSSIWDIGTNIVEGIWQGISNGYSWIKDKITGWVGDVIGFFKRILGIASPSKVFAELGGFMSEGVAVGIEGNVGSVERAVGDMSDAAINAWSADRLNMGITGAASYSFGNASVNDSKTLADSITAALNGCGVYMDGQIVGKLVTKFQSNTARAYG